MAGSFSDYLENKILDHLFGRTTFTAPATLYVALLTVTPSDTGGGTEVTGGAYARASVTNNTTNFGSASSGSKKNATAILFPQATADWGTVVAFAIYDAYTGGNLQMWGTLTTSRVVSSGDSPVISVNDLTITLD